jgi:hypothetical protein
MVGMAASLVFYVTAQVYNGKCKLGDGVCRSGWGDAGGRVGACAVVWGARAGPRVPCLAGRTCMEVAGILCVLGLCLLCALGFV